MSERLTQMQRMVSDSRRRLEGLARRLDAVQQRLGVARASQASEAPGDVEIPLFMAEEGGTGAGAIDEAELNFEALDPDPEREKR